MDLKGGGLMTNNFFGKEVENVQQRFNQTFGQLATCDLCLRQAVIVSIGLMGRLAERIDETNHPTKPHNIIGKFMRIQNALNVIFNRIENAQKERGYRNEDCRAGKNTDTGTIPGKNPMAQNPTNLNTPK